MGTPGSGVRGVSTVTLEILYDRIGSEGPRFRKVPTSTDTLFPS